MKSQQLWRIVREEAPLIPASVEQARQQQIARQAQGSKLPIAVRKAEQLGDARTGAFRAAKFVQLLEAAQMGPV